MFTAALAALSVVAPTKPKLVVLISIDQFRGDYVERFQDQFLPAKNGGKLGGFRFLMETGAHYTDAHHNHVPTATGPGHATLMSGSEPFINGIAGNDWFDRKTGKRVYCVDDASVKTVGGPSSPMSPRNLKVTTVGDELKMATNGRSHVVGIAFKDRASILMAGHAADTVIWFDTKNGAWVTSTFYANQLPSWVEEINAKQIPAKTTGQKWEPLLGPDAYKNARVAPFAKPVSPTLAFSHEIKPGLRDFTTSSFGQEYVFQTVEKALDAESLGKHETPDVLVVNLSTNDYVGHAYGPNSPEVMDITVRTDRLLSGLLNAIDKRLGIDNVDVVISGDHGVVPIPEEADGTYRTGAKRVLTAPVFKAVQAAFTREYGDGEWVIGGDDEMYVYLNHKLLEEKKIRPADAERLANTVVRNAPNVFAAFTRTQVLQGELPRQEWTQLISNGYNAEFGGDVIFFFKPGDYVGGGTGTGHGAPWKYDSHVPIILRGPGITKGRFSRTVATADIAPTLANILGIEVPSGSVGHPLYEAIDRK